MKINCALFYFSQTGGTKKIAELIAKSFQDSGHKCELFRFTKKNKDIEMVKDFDFSSIDLIGIGIPVYYFQPPYHIFDILNEFPDLSGKFGFLFCTSGGAPHSTLYQMKQVLDEKGLRIIEGNDKVKCLDKHPFYRDFNYVFPPSIGHPNESDFKISQNFAEAVINKVTEEDPNEKLDFWKKKNVFAQLMDFEGLNSTFPDFSVNTSKCTQCKLCMRICPVDCIELSPYPKWTKSCDRCYLCEMKCPENAIECDWDAMVSFMNRLMKKKGFIPKEKPKYSLKRKIHIWKKLLQISMAYLKVRLGMKRRSIKS